MVCRRDGPTRIERDHDQRARVGGHPPAPQTARNERDAVPEGLLPIGGKPEKMPGQQRRIVNPRSECERETHSELG